MTTSLGQLVSDLFAKYEREFQDDHLAALATEVRISELLERANRERRTRVRRAA